MIDNLHKADMLEGKSQTKWLVNLSHFI